VISRASVCLAVLYFCSRIFSVFRLFCAFHNYAELTTHCSFLAQLAELIV